MPALVLVGLPATLVRRRPDLRQAEARLHSATAQVAEAEFYPDVTLAGSFRLESLQFKDAFNLYSRAFEAGPSISWT